MLTNQSRRATVPYRLPLLALVTPLLLGLSGCTEVTRFLARAESKPAAESGDAPQVVQEAAPDPIPAPQEKPKPGKLYEWSGDGRRVSRIVVSTDEQKARFYDGDEQIGWTTVASGVSKFPTPTGQFEVMEKVANKRSNLYGKIYGAGGRVVRADAKAGRDQIPDGARFEGAQMPYFLRLTNDGIGLHAGPIPRPGRPASHGCIRMPSKLAPVLFQHVDLGTKVSIVGSGPSYGNYVQKQRALAARERQRREEAARMQATAAATTSGTTTSGTTTLGSTTAQARTPEAAAATQPLVQSEGPAKQDRREGPSPSGTLTTETATMAGPPTEEAVVTSVPAPEPPGSSTPPVTHSATPDPAPSTITPVAHSATPEPSGSPPAPAPPPPMLPAAATLPPPVPMPIVAPAPAPNHPAAPMAPPASAEQPATPAEQGEG